MIKPVRCPTCGRPVDWTPESRWRPFCSERCRLIDLGAWLDEQHRIEGPDEEGQSWLETEPEQGPRPH